MGINQSREIDIDETLTDNRGVPDISLESGPKLNVKSVATDCEFSSISVQDDHCVESDVSDVELIIPSPRSHSLLLGINQHQSSVNKLSKNVPQEHKPNNRVSEDGSPGDASLAAPFSVKKLCLKSKYQRRCMHSGASKPNVNIRGEHIAVRDSKKSNNKVSKDGSPCDAFLVFLPSPEHAHESDTRDVLSSARDTSTVQKLCLKSKFQRKCKHSGAIKPNVNVAVQDSKKSNACRHSDADKTSDNVLGEHNTTTFSPEALQSTNANIDVPEVDLIASSSSHLPSSAINQPRNIDVT